MLVTSPPGLMTPLPVGPDTDVRGRGDWPDTRPPELETTPPGPVKALEMPLLLKAGPWVCAPPTTELRGRDMRAGPGREEALRRLALPALILLPRFWAEGRVSPSPKTQTKTVRLGK